MIHICWGAMTVLYIMVCREFLFVHPYFKTVGNKYPGDPVVGQREHIRVSIRLSVTDKTSSKLVANLEFGFRGAHLLFFFLPPLFFLLLPHFPLPPLDSWLKIVGGASGLHELHKTRGAGAPLAPPSSAAGNT